MEGKIIVHLLRAWHDPWLPNQVLWKVNVCPAMDELGSFLVMVILQEELEVGMEEKA